MNKFLALIMDLTAVWMLLAIVYHDLSYNCSAWFGVLAFILFIFAPFVSQD